MTSVSGASTPTRFIIVATQRTGSTWLVDKLNSHPGIAAYEELFLAQEAHHGTWGSEDKEFFYAYYARRARRPWLPGRVLWSLRYLEEVYSTPSTEAVGLKLMYGQLRAYPWLLAYLPVRRVRVVHLVRTNLLDVILSRKTAEARRQYHARASDRVDHIAVHLEAEQLVSQLESLQGSVDTIRRLLRLLPTPSLETSYERLTTSEAALDELLHFLNVTSTPLSSRLTKLNREPRQSLIANYEEVERVLRGTRFEPLLAE
jgi:LPS sulfotransferase NodH